MSRLLSTARSATRHVRIRAIRTLSLHTCRVVFIGTAATNLTDLTEVSLGTAVKPVFPYERVGSGRTPGRAYAIRRYHVARRELEIDFIVHDEIPATQHGPVTRWLEHVAPGDEVEFTGPKRNFHAGPVAPWTLFIGDETALPAAFAILETLPEHAQMLTYIVIDDARARLSLEGALIIHPHSYNTHWVRSDTIYTGAMMIGAPSTQAMPVDTPQISLVGEASLLRQARTLLEGAWAVPHDAIDARDYWTAGLLREERKVSEAR